MKILKYFMLGLVAIFATMSLFSGTFDTPLGSVYSVTESFGIGKSVIDSVFEFLFGLSGFAVAAAPVIPFIDNSGNALYSEEGGPIGSQARTGECKERSKIAEADCPFGFPLGYGDNGSMVKPMTTGSTQFLGISKYNPQAQGFAVYNGSAGKRYLAGEAVLVAIEGTFWVQVEEAVDEKSPVRIRLVDHDSIDTKKQGYFATTPEAGKTALLKGVSFDSAQVGGTGGSVMVRITDSVEVIAD